MVVGAKKRSQAEKGQFVEKRQELGLGLGRSVPSKGDSRCKGPEAGVCRRDR